MLLRRDTAIGGEFGYNWTWAEGTYNGTADGDRIMVNYPEMKGYMRHKF